MLKCCPDVEDLRNDEGIGDWRSRLYWLQPD
jgi:hypothetical protein